MRFGEYLKFLREMRKQSARVPKRVSNSAPQKCPKVVLKKKKDIYKTNVIYLPTNVRILKNSFEVADSSRAIRNLLVFSNEMGHEESGKKMYYVYGISLS